MPLRFLLIEDNDDDALILKLELRKGGFDPDLVRVDTPQALESALDESDWDAVIADYNMPSFTGLDALRLIQSMGLDLPFILISGVIGEEKAVDAMKAGAHDYILKGNFSRLAPALKRELREAEVRRERRLAVDELQRAHRNLEIRVQQRTADLARINEELLAEMNVRKLAEEKIIAYQDQLRSMTSEISFIEEKERHKIATAIHDLIGQPLAMAGIKLGGLRQVAGPGDMGQQIEEIRDMISQAIHYSRTLTFELSPAILYELGLEAAVSSLADRYQKEHGIRIEYHDDRQPKPLSDEMRILMFQGARELIVNALKHAHPQKIIISIRREGENICVAVEDDGVGFDLANGELLKGESQGFGLFSLRERLMYLGGSIAISSNPGSGTQVTMNAPLRTAPEETGEKA